MGANCQGCNPRELTAEALRRELPGVQPREPRHWEATFSVRYRPGKALRCFPSFFQADAQ